MDKKKGNPKDPPSIDRIKDHIVYILGDFNFVVDLRDRTDLATGLSTGRPCSIGRYWLDAFEEFDEMYQQSHTGYPGCIAETGSSARLDRSYCEGGSQKKFRVLKNVESMRKNIFLDAFSHFS